ncbi:hypothetical protein AFB00_23265 [Pseudonocardia sp. HH130630-07]|nr:hypothetical protein AFB00_23265 [Pseudonocardia sp. HH130630-07]
MVAVQERRLRDAAADRGLALGTIFAEHDRGTRIAFGDLLDTLDSSGVRHVLVPDFGHFSPHPLLQALMLGRLRRRSAAQVHVVDG